MPVSFFAGSPEVLGKKK